MTDDDRQNFAAMREFVYRYIAKSLEEDGHCKSYEGAWEFAALWPSYFEKEKPTEYCLTLHCYLLGPNRHYDWIAATPGECIANAWKDVRKWSAGDFSLGELKWITGRQPVLESK